MELAIRRGINGCVKRIHRFNKLGVGDALNEWIVVRMQGAHRTKRNRDGNVNDNRLKAMPAKTCGRCNFDNVPLRIGREPSDKGNLIGKWVRIVADPVTRRANTINRVFLIGRDDNWPSYDKFHVVTPYTFRSIFVHMLPQNPPSKKMTLVHNEARFNNGHAKCVHVKLNRGRWRELVFNDTVVVSLVCHSRMICEL